MNEIIQMVTTVKKKLFKMCKILYKHFWEVFEFIKTIKFHVRDIIINTIIEKLNKK